VNLKSWLIAAGLAAALAVWMASGTLINGHADAPPPASTVAERQDRPVMSVAVRQVTAEPVVRLLTAQGELLPNRQATLRAETDGRVVELLAERGALVSEGEALLRLSMDDRQARLDQAKARIDRYGAEYAAASRLHKQGMQAETQVKAAFAELQEARAELRLVELEIGHTTIVAPFDGILEERSVELGEYVAEGAEVLTLVDVTPLKVVIDVPQQQIANIRLGQNAHVELFNGERREARVTYIAPVAQSGTRTFATELEVANPGAPLPAGMSAEVELPLETVRGHFLSPAVLALDADGQLGVKAVDADDEVRFHAARVVRAERDGVWLAGLPERLSVITIGQGFVRPGDRVRPVAEDGGSALARSAAPGTGPDGR
jgi:multidrug efflux system membrane fusion protein